MSKLLIFIISCMFCFSSFTKSVAQTIDAEKYSSNNIAWNDGTIYLTSGEVLTGLVKLNTKTGLLAFEDRDESRVLTAKNVVSFDYFDHQINAKKSFISAIYKAEPVLGKKNKASVYENGIPQFYEILIECKNFALLASTSNMSAKLNQSVSSSNPAMNHTFITYSQTESLMVFDSEGVITPLLDITQTDNDQALFGPSEKRKSKKLDNDAIEKYTGPYFTQLESYAKERKLSFKRKDDLIKILEYYKSISQD